MTAEQGALRFDEPAVERSKQLGFDFSGPAEPSRSPDSPQPHVGNRGMTPPRERERGEVPPTSTAGASIPADEAARSFGRELVAEVRLAHTESSLSAERSAKERRRLKEQLIEDRREHARASEEAGRHRTALAALGVAEPPCWLKDGERSYLQFMFGRVSERLRERIAAEVARAQIIPDREEETPCPPSARACAAGRGLSPVIGEGRGLTAGRR